MYAHMGMKIEEWEDGQVNIGIAVCPTKPTAIAAKAAAENGGNDMLMSNDCGGGSDGSSGNFVVVPNSAFIIRPPEHYQSQGGVSVTYAHQRKGPSNFFIMLNPQDQGYQNNNKSMISYLQQQQQQNIQSNDIIATENNNMEPIERNEDSGEGSEEVGSTPAESEKVEEKASDGNKNKSESSLREKEEKESCGESDSLKSPQSADEAIEISKGLEEAAITPKKEATGSSSSSTAAAADKEASSLSPTTKKSSSDMKRVSWVEDAEKFDDTKESGKSHHTHKENRRDSVRRSNGVGSNGNSNWNGAGLAKKQHGFSSDMDVGANTIADGYTTKGNNRRSGDRSRIPLIAASAGDAPTSCEFYRRQMLRECMYNNPTNMADNWYGYTSIQKYAGEKVVKKIAAEQKRLEEDISNRRKTEIWILGNETDDFIISPSAVPLRKRTMRLKPIQIVQ